MSKGQMRISLLNPTDDISALKLRGWLQAEVSQINGQAGEKDFIVIRLFLTQKVLYGFTQKKVDALLQGIVDKYPRIQGIELVEVERPLSLGEMQEEAASAKVELEENSKLAKEQREAEESSLGQRSLH